MQGSRAAPDTMQGMENAAEPFAEIVQSLREIVAQLARIDSRLATIEAALKQDPVPSNPPQVILDEPRERNRRK